MAKPDPALDQRILESAKKEFLAKGFEKASLKEICQGAGVTTGALYNRYQGKEDLFHGVVADTVADLEGVLREKSTTDFSNISDAALLQAWDMQEDYMMWWFDFLDQRRDGFVLLLKCAEGTRYGNFQHDWVDQMSQSTYRYYQEAYRRGLFHEAVSPEEMHVLLTAFWATIYEPFIHGYRREALETHCKLVCHFINWFATFGVSPGM